MTFDYQLHHRILTWLEEAAENIRESHKRTLNVEEKTSNSDLVTEMDKATEWFFVERIREYYPTHRVLGEEGIGERVTDLAGYVWIIDPIDGTLNFVKQKNHFGIMIGIYLDGKPMAGYIVDVMNQDVYYGIVGDGAYLNHQPLVPLPIQSLEDSLIVGNCGVFVNNVGNSQSLLRKALGARSYGSAALEIITVLRGEAALYISPRLNPWDFAAGNAICQSMGIRVTKADGTPLNMLEKSSVLFAHDAVYEEAIALMKEEKKVGNIDEYA